MRLTAACHCCILVHVKQSALVSRPVLIMLGDCTQRKRQNGVTLRSGPFLFATWFTAVSRTCLGLLSSSSHKCELRNREQRTLHSIHSLKAKKIHLYFCVQGGPAHGAVGTALVWRGWRSGQLSACRCSAEDATSPDPHAGNHKI